jgi:hypothetical protein
MVSNGCGINGLVRLRCGREVLKGQRPILTMLLSNSLFQCHSLEEVGLNMLLVITQQKIRYSYTRTYNVVSIRQPPTQNAEAFQL